MTRIPTLGPRGEGWVWLQFTLFGAVAVVAVVASPWPAGGGRVAATAAGALVTVAGIAQFVASVRGLGPSLSALPKPRRRATLRMDGVYGRVRHPMYGAVILVALGIALLRGPAVLIPALLLAIVLDLKSRREEAFLIERFEGYAAYQGRVRRRFLPDPRSRS